MKTTSIPATLDGSTENASFRRGEHKVASVQAFSDLRKQPPYPRPLSDDFFDPPYRHVNSVGGISWIAELERRVGQFEEPLANPFGACALDVLVVADLASRQSKGKACKSTNAATQRSRPGRGVAKLTASGK